MSSKITAIIKLFLYSKDSPEKNLNDSGVVAYT